MIAQAVWSTLFWFGLDGSLTKAMPRPQEMGVDDCMSRDAQWQHSYKARAATELLLLVKDPSLYLARAVMNMVMVTIFSIVYLEARHRIQTQAQQRCFFFVFCMAIPANFAIGVVILSNLGLKSIAREVKDGMYHPLAQWVASSIVQAPMMFVLAASALWPAFWGAQLPHAAFGTAIAVFSSLLWCFEGVAEMFSLVKNPLAGMLYFLFFFIFAFLFCGMFIAFDDVVVFLRWICYITPFGYVPSSQSQTCIPMCDL